MARIAPNGLIVSDGGEWYYLNPKWHAYLDKPTEKRPGFMAALGAAKLTGEQLRVGNTATKHGAPMSPWKRADQFKQLIAESGSVALAEAKLRELYGIAESNKPVDAASATGNSQEATPSAPLAPQSRSLAMDKLHQRAEKLLASSLSPGEGVLGRLNGINNTQALVLTDQRALIIKVGFMSGQSFGGKVTTFEYRNITSVEARVSMMTGSFEIAAGGVSGAEHAYWGGKQNDAWHAPNVIPIAKRQMATFQHAASIIRERSRVATTPQPVSAPATQVASVPERLKELASLRDAGIVTEEEFSKKKAELLERL